VESVEREEISREGTLMSKNARILASNVIGLSIMFAFSAVFFVVGDVRWWFAGYVAMYPFAIWNMRLNGDNVGWVKEHVGFDIVFLGLVLSIAIDSAGPFVIALFIMYFGICATFNFPIRIGPGI
jgi:hypothetical protein